MDPGLFGLPWILLLNHQIHILKNTKEMDKCKGSRVSLLVKMYRSKNLICVRTKKRMKSLMIKEMCQKKRQTDFDYLKRWDVNLKKKY